MKRIIGNIPSVPEIIVFAVGLFGCLLIGFSIGRTSANSRLDAYRRCVSLMDHGAQWDESEGGWRCKVIAGEK